MSLTNVSLSLLVADADVQPRVLMSAETIEDYAEAMRAGAEFPPIVVYSDGESYWIADGFHRYYAATAAGLDYLPADVRRGDKRAAVLHSVGANATHGQRRTNEDKRRAVSRLLDDAQWSAWSDREIARRCGVHQDMVGRLRPVASVGFRQIDAQPAPTVTRTVERNGTVYEMRTEQIGRRPMPETPAEYDAPEHRPIAETLLANGVPDEEVAALMRGPEPEPPERKALSQVIYMGHVTRFDPRAVADSVPPDVARSQRESLLRIAGWIQQVADALESRRPLRAV